MTGHRDLNRPAGRWVPCIVESPIGPLAGHAKYGGLQAEFEVFLKKFLKNRVSLDAETVVATNSDASTATLFKPYIVDQRASVAGATSLNIKPSLCVIGPRAWEKTDVVHSFEAQISGADGVFEDIEVDQKLSASDLDDNFDSSLVEITCPTWTGRVLRTGHFSWNIHGFVPTGYGIAVEFFKPVDFDGVRKAIFEVRSFLIMCTGADVEFSEIKVSSSTASAKAEQFKLMTRIGKPNDKSPFDSIITARFDGIETVEGALNRWVNLDETWREAKIGAFRFCIEDRSNHGDRLLDACRWYEKLPTAKQEPVLAETDRNCIVEKILSSLSETESFLRERIRNALTFIHLEDRRSVVKRIVTRNEHLIRDNSRWEGLISLTLKALRERGKYAHGPSGANSSGELKTLVSYVDAVSFICFGEMLKAVRVKPRENGFLAVHPMNHFRFSSK